MGDKPLRPCRYPGCYALVPDGYCQAHQPQRIERRSDAAKEYRKLYNTKLWKERLRPGQLLREPFCRECAKHGLRAMATDADHIVDHKGDLALFSDPENLESLCHTCHSKKTAAEQIKTKQKNRRR